MLLLMPPRAGKKKSKKSASRVATKAPPRTVRLPFADDDWVEEQGKTHPDGASGVICDAVRRHREQLDANQRVILEAIA